VIHLINNSGSNAMTVLNSGSSFTTSFKGLNDVVITPVTGRLNSLYLETFGGTRAANNPAYVTNFIGNSTDYTGDGTAGSIRTMETAMGAVTNRFQFDFSLPLTPLDHLLIADVENNEQYVIEAYILRGGTHQQVGLARWQHQNFAGQTGMAPDSNWARWDGTNGTLTGVSGSYNEPLTVLTPDQLIDRVVISKAAVGSGSAAIQFLAEPGSAATPQLSIRQEGAAANVVSWPTAFEAWKLYRTATPGPVVQWDLVTNVPATSGFSVFVTNSVPGTNEFYRLQSQ
jgi:hypothetical protein